MCGICGIFSPNPSVHTYIDQMTIALEHRGPDGHSTWQNQHVSLGHRRLSIIDLNTGNQPIVNENETMYIIFNGEIYNFIEIRKTLQDLGHIFSTRSDTEIIIHTIEQWGIDGLDRLNGMWAFALWNTQEQWLLLSRDRFGKKPLYYFQPQHDLFLFASEIKSLLAHPSVQPSIRQNSVAEYLCYGYVPYPNTWYQGIYELPPGYNLIINHTGVNIKRWWDIKPIMVQPKQSISLEDAGIEVRKLISKAVNQRMTSDVPIGAFLSGGIDSSIIVAEMQKLSAQPIKTFSIGFDQGGWYDESAYAQMVASYLGTDHHEFRVTPNAYDLLDVLVEHYDEPFADSSALPTYLLSKHTRNHVSVALSGDGGDEIFSGYERFRFATVNQLYQQIPTFFTKPLAHLIDYLPAQRSSSWIAQLQRVHKKLRYPVAAGFPRWVMLWEPQELRNLLNEYIDLDPSSYFLAHTKDISDILSAVMAYNLVTYLPQDLLVKLDRMSMAHGLEVRSPFLDINLIEWALRLSVSLLWKGFTGKRILREAYQSILPSTILQRKKHGFGVPLDTWFRKELKGFIADTLLSPSAYIYNYLDKEVIKQLCDQHWQQRQNAGHRLWALLTFEIWLQKQSVLYSR